MGGGFSTVDDLARFAEALMQHRLLKPETTVRVMSGHIAAGYGGSERYGLETRVLDRTRIVGHQGQAPGVSNQLDFYPDLGHVLVVLGNTDSNGTQDITRRVREIVARSMPTK
jgi:CubicO group peptidase (beta-lactamase class C family)